MCFKLYYNYHDSDTSPIVRTIKFVPLHQKSEVAVRINGCALTSCTSRLSHSLHDLFIVGFGSIPMIGLKLGLFCFGSREM